MFIISARLKWDFQNQNTKYIKLKQPTVKVSPWQTQHYPNNGINNMQVTVPEYQGYGRYNQNINSFQPMQSFNQQVPQVVGIWYMNDTNDSHK